jgi:hypothetical protein
MKKKKLRPLGHILLDMEPLILEMVLDHDLQHGDLLYLLKGYLDAHCCESVEQYTDGSGSPVLYYGPAENIKIKGQ